MVTRIQLLIFLFYSFKMSVFWVYNKKNFHSRWADRVLSPYYGTPHEDAGRLTTWTCWTHEDWSDGDGWSGWSGCRAGRWQHWKWWQWRAAGVGRTRPPARAERLRRYLGWPTLPGRRRWRTGGLRWRGWLSFGPPPPLPLKWPGSATAERSYLERGAREGGVKAVGWGLRVAWAGPDQNRSSEVRRRTGDSKPSDCFPLPLQTN